MYTQTKKHINQLRRSAVSFSFILPALNCASKTIDKTEFDLRDESKREWERECEYFTIAVSARWMFALSCCQICRCLQKRPHRYRAMFVKRCQYLLYYKSYVDLSTTTLITIGLKLVYSKHSAFSIIKHKAEVKCTIFARICWICVYLCECMCCTPEIRRRVFSRILMYRDFMNHTTLADSIHSFSHSRSHIHIVYWSNRTALNILHILQNTLTKRKGKKKHTHR